MFEEHYSKCWCFPEDSITNKEMVTKMAQKHTHVADPGSISRVIKRWSFLDEVVFKDLMDVLVRWRLNIYIGENIVKFE